MRWLYILSLALLFFSCNSYAPAADPLDAAREFIDASLKGDFQKAAFYMVPDEANKQQLEKMEKAYGQRSSKEKAAYHDASINILEEDAVSDSVHIINYKNSYDNVARKARVVQQNGNWLVDLKYSFDGNL